MGKFANYLTEQHKPLFEDEFNEWIDKNSLIIEKTFVAAPEHIQQPWGNETDLKNLYDRMLKYVTIAKDEFASKLKKVASKVAQPKVMVDVKSIKSTIDKVQRRGKNPGELTDILRAAILVNNVEDIKTVNKRMKHVFNLLEFEVKEPTEDPEFGYFGSFHFLVKVEGVVAEVQVMTKKLWAYKEEAHKIYNKYRDHDKASADLKALDQNLSKKIFTLGNKENPKQLARRQHTKRAGGRGKLSSRDYAQL